MTLFKKTILFCHRWLGFISGIVVFIVSITGCIFCFQDEIQDAIYDYRHVARPNTPYKKPSELLAITERQYPKSSKDYIMYNGKDRPAVVFVTVGPDDFQQVFIDPYSGKITHHQKSDENFFVIIENIHMYLLLPYAVGRWVVGISVIIFMVIMVTGIILWWPKRKSDRKRSFTIKWGAKWRRVNYDLHNVLGFYALAIGLILGTSGLAITFEAVSDALYKIANGGKVYAWEKTEPKSDTLHTTLTAGQPVVDLGFAYAQRTSPKAQMFLIHNDPTAAGAIGVGAYAKSLHYYDRDWYEFDKYSGRLLQTYMQDKKSPGLKLQEMNYDIHVGQILGLQGKILAFLASLICASLPITGFIIWLGKRNKKNKPGKGGPRRRGALATA